MSDLQGIVYVPDVTQMPVGVPEAATGALLFFGIGSPTGGIGADAAYYIDTASLVLYGPRASGAWPAGTSLRGQDGGTLPLVAGAAVPAHRSLMFAADGSAILGDPTATSYVWAGLAAAAASTGTAVQAVRAGLLTDPAWRWTPLAPLFAVPGGLLSHRPPTTGAYHRVGAAVTATTILVAPDPVITRP